MNLTQQVKESYWKDLEDQLKLIFYQIVFQPIFELTEQYSEQMRLAHEELVNAASDEPLRMALRSGQVQYADGTFSGVFNAAIGRTLRGLGARFNSRTKTYFLNPSLVPGWIKAEAGVYKVLAKEAHAAIKRALGYVESGLDQLTEKYQIKPKQTIERFQKDFVHIAKEIQVTPTLSEASKDQMAESFKRDMKELVTINSEKMMDDLYKAVDENAQQGYRFDRLTDVIKNRYQMSQAKAQFLARQETAMYMAKFRKARFQEAGVTRYKWSTSHDERVRSKHKELDGKTFSYDSPPIVDKATGRKANPGEDFNCRCVDLPILGLIIDQKEAVQ